MNVKKRVASLAVSLATLFTFAVAAHAGQGRSPYPPARAAAAVPKIHWSNLLYRGFESAVRQRKPLIVYFYQRECHYCQRTQREVFPSAKINSLAETAVFVAVDTLRDEDDKGNVARLQRDLRADRIPTLVVLDVGPGWITERGRIVGYFDAETYYYNLTQILLAPPRGPRG